MLKTGLVGIVNFAVDGSAVCRGVLCRVADSIMLTLTQSSVRHRAGNSVVDILVRGADAGALDARAKGEVTCT